jgi:hypothetical protein
MRVTRICKVALLALPTLLASAMGVEAQLDASVEALSAYDQRLQAAFGNDLGKVTSRVMVEDQCAIGSDGCNNYYMVRLLTMPYIRARFLTTERPSVPRSYLLLSHGMRLEYIPYMTLAACPRPPRYRCLRKMLPEDMPFTATGAAAEDLHSSSWLSAGRDPTPLVDLRSPDLGIGCLPIDTRRTANRSAADLPGMRSLALNSLCRNGVLP